MNKSNNTILVIDDEVQIQKLLKINLESNDYNVIQSFNGKDGIRLAASHSPDLILLDISLPDISGTEVLKSLMEWYYKPIIMLSVENNEKIVVYCLDNGAIDYLSKPFRTLELLARIRIALKRYNTGNEINSIIKIDDLEIDYASHLIKKSNNIIKLTSTEYKILSLFFKNEGKVLTHQYILKEIWGSSFNQETQYLRVFIASIRKKIEDNPNKPKHIITESGIGYRFQ